MGVVVEMIDAVGVKEACAPHHAVDFVAFPEQELGKIRAVLPGDAGDQCTLGRGRRPLDYYGLHRPEACRRRGRMGAKLSFKYDRDADILHIDKRSPYPEQESEELGDEVIARLNPNTGEVENLEVLFFSTRLLRGELFELPISAELRIAGGR